jgi:hypothetical protein
MTQVITSGKTILDEPVPASRSASLFAVAKKIVDFEKRLSDHMPEPEQLSNITVLLQHDYLPCCIHRTSLLIFYSIITKFSQLPISTNLFRKSRPAIISRLKRLLVTPLTRTEPPLLET